MTGYQRLQISPNKRFIIQQDGQPFFYLGDTAWELFHRLTREEANHYLADRAAKRFNVIQAVVLAEFDGFTEPNQYGQLPLIDNDPARPNERYFEHVDYIVDQAASLGLYIGMLPTWADKVGPIKWHGGPEIFTPENARVYGEYLGRRYKEKPIIWILGGDRMPETEQQIESWRAMAAGIKHGDGGQHLITYHPSGRHSSAEIYHNEPWLDFNMIQSGHSVKDFHSYEMIRADYERVPIKPILDGEPRYEDHPVRQKPEQGWFDVYDVRKAAYWALFAGAFGHTYGCHDIWQFLDERHPPITQARTPWREALHLPGASQMQYARALLESRPFLSRIPDQSLIASEIGSEADHVQATRDADGSYAMIYLPTGKAVTIDLSKLSGTTSTAYWYDPRNGVATQFSQVPNSGSEQEFAPPTSGFGNDWVLVLDDSSKHYPLPGSS